MNPKKLDILITGGLGFIGSNLAIKLIDEDHKVTIIDSLIDGYGGNIYNLKNFEKLTSNRNFCSLFLESEFSSHSRYSGFRKFLHRW